MGLTFTEDQQELRKTLRAFLADKSPESEVRRLMATSDGYDKAVWRQMCDQLCLTGMHVPERFGGLGYSFVETAIALEEAGRALLCAPLLSSVIASMAILISGDDAAQELLLPDIASGRALATVALTEPSGRWDPDGVTVSAVQEGQHWTLAGAKSFVLDGCIADWILVFARGECGVGLFAVHRDAAGVRPTLLDTLDETRKLARVDFEQVEAIRIGSETDGDDLYDKVLRCAVVSLANEQAGVAERAMDMSIEYATNRIQFGRPIGSFQAIKHKCADLLVAVESAKSAAYVAAQALADESGELSEIASIAGSFCSDACLMVGHETIQIHGAIAFTWEYPVHLYYKRAKSSEVLFGDTLFHRDCLARVIGL